MKLFKFTNILMIFLIISCSIDDSNEAEEIEFIPGDVIVKTRNYFTIEEVFDFINNFDHEVKSIKHGIYTTDMPNDSLDYILHVLNEKSYTNDGISFFTTGYIHSQTKDIRIFPKFFNIKTSENQTDWKEAMQKLQLREKTNLDTHGYTIFFKVEEGTEKVWKSKFEEYTFVEWAELNFNADIILN